jgi:hypothetical protein
MPKARKPSPHRQLVRTLVVCFDVTGWPQAQVNALIHEVVSQAEASDDHPEAPVGLSTTWAPRVR